MERSPFEDVHMSSLSPSSSAADRAAETHSDQPETAQSETQTQESIREDEDQIGPLDTSAQMDSLDPGVNRSTTFPPRAQGHARDGDHTEGTDNSGGARRRGATLSSMRQSIEPPDRLGSIQENKPLDLSQMSQGDAGSIKSPSVQRSTTGITFRERSGTGLSRRRPRGFTLGRTPTLVRRPTALTTGRANSIHDSEHGGIPGDFTLAGPDSTQAAQNQPYVDPAYAALNPAYAAPTNQRPVWGVAKPLPRVLRPGMVPTPSELNLSKSHSGGQQPDAGSHWDVDDIEKGKPSLRRAGTFQAVSDLAAQREARLLRRQSTVRSSDARTSIDEQAAARTESFPAFPGGALPTPIQEIEEEDGPAYFDRTTSHPFSFNPSHGGRAATAKYTSDANSDITEVENEDELDEDAWPALISYGMQTGHPEDEIHNHHTRWSVIRTRYREPLAEFLGVFIQLTIGFCADLSITVSANTNDFNAAYAWGFATMSAIYVAGGISGAHLNPAISILLYIYRGFPIRKIPVYVFAQVLGAFLAALVAFALYRTAILEYAAGASLAASGTADSFITSRRHNTVNAATAFFNEFVATACLAAVVLALGDDSNAPPGAGMSALVLGLVIVALSLAFGYNTGCGMNPSRDLGPRLALLAVGYGSEELFHDGGYWVYGPWAATITGALVGGGLYDIAIFVGGESPVNYPRKRIWRAGHKFKKRMGKRLRRESIPDALR